MGSVAWLHAKVPEFLWVRCGSQERESDLLILRRNPAKGNTWMDEMTSVEGRILETKRRVQASWVTRGHGPLEDTAHKGLQLRDPQRKRNYWAIKKATLESAAPRGHRHQLISPPTERNLISSLPCCNCCCNSSQQGGKRGWETEMTLTLVPLLFTFPGWRRREMLNQNWRLQFWSDTGWDWFIPKKKTVF